MDPTAYGYAAGIVLSLMWGVAPAFTSLASTRAGSSFSSLGFNAWRSIITLPFLLILVFELGSPDISDQTSFIEGVLIASIFGSVVGDYLLVKAVETSGASATIPASYTYVVWVNLIEWISGKGSPVLAQSLLAFAGILLSSEPWKAIDRRVKGVIYGFASALFWTLAIFGFDLSLTSLDASGIEGPVYVAFLRNLISMLIMIPWAVKWSRIFRTVWRETLWATVTGYIIGYTALVLSVAYLGPGRSSLFLAAVPVLTPWFSNKMAGERPGIPQFLGGVLVGLSILCIGL